MTINISGPGPNSIIATPPPGYFDNYSGPANPACFLHFFSAQHWGGQSFTTIQKYNLASVELWIKKGPGANVGNVNVELRAVDGSGHPTGPPLNSGVIPNADISEDYAWVSCDLDDMRLTTYQLDAATKFCIVVNGLGFTVVHLLKWACGGDGSDYPNGDQEWSVNGGVAWSTDNTRDQLFRCYPTPWLDNYSGTALGFLALNLNSANDWAGQSFTAMKSYTLNRIDMWLDKGPGDNVGNIIVALYDVDGNGHPDIAGGALATGIIPDVDVLESPSWVRCDMSQFNVVVDTKYCNVVHGYSLDASNVLTWCHDNYAGSSDFAGGDLEWSTDGGGAWSTTTTSDLLFRCYSA